MAEQVIQMSYPDMAEMKKAFQQTVEQLNQTRSEMQTIAGQMADGALLGQGGAAFTEGIQSSLVTSIQKLTQKVEELITDIDAAVQEMQAADAESKSKF